MTTTTATTAPESFETWLANFLTEGMERFGSVDAFTAALAAYNAEKGL